MRDVADHFGWLVGRARHPVVFFIDNLDRCTEGYVVDLLDTIQTLVRDAGPPPLGRRRLRRQSKPSSTACFIIAADGCWLRKSYEVTYDKFAASVAEPGRPLGYLFLDKLFQLRVPVPSMDMHKHREYLSELLGVHAQEKSDAECDEVVREGLRRSSTEAEIVETLQRASPDLRDQMAATAVERLTDSDVAAATEHSLERFGPLLAANPRSMKRFVNEYSILRAVRLLEGNPVASEPLALWAILQTRWPSLADYLRGKPEAIRLLRKAGDQLDAVPSDLRALFEDPHVLRVTEFAHGGPLTEELIRACCGAT
jgi:hypothetical protein